MKVNCGCSRALGGMRGLGANGLLESGAVAQFNPADPYYSKLMQLSPQSLATGGNIDALLAQQNASQSVSSDAKVCTTPQCVADMSQLNKTLAAGGNVVGGGNPGAVSTSDIVIGTFDVTTFLSQYGLWIAAGAAALLMLKNK